MTATPISERPARLDALFRAQQRRLWGLAYRLTASAEDADDIVQEAFVRLSAQQPEPGDVHVGPWLARVVTNLGVDALRRRRRRAYVGPWLPTAIDAETCDAHASELPDPEARYGLAESMTYAFLLALEVLGPRQRAVLLLRDVLGCSARETAALVETSEGNVRVLHARARSALAGYDAHRCVPTPELCDRHRATLQRLLACFVAEDADGLAVMFADTVRTVTDAGGEYTALATPLAGRMRVARFYATAARNRRIAGPRFELLVVNGLPAVLITLERPVRRQAPRTLLRCELDGDGRICVIQAILAPPKLARLAA